MRVWNPKSSSNMFAEAVADLCVCEDVYGVNMPFLPSRVTRRIRSMERENVQEWKYRDSYNTAYEVEVNVYKLHSSDIYFISQGKMGAGEWWVTDGVEWWRLLRQMLPTAKTNAAFPQSRDMNLFISIPSRST